MITNKEFRRENLMDDFAFTNENDTDTVYKVMYRIEQALNNRVKTNGIDDERNGLMVMINENLDELNEKFDELNEKFDSSNNNLSKIYDALEDIANKRG